MHWFLLQTKPNAYLVACSHLRRQGFDVFFPRILKTSKKRGRFVDNLSPLFPGYIFMGTIADQIPWKSINATRGISRAVTLDGTYRSVNNEIIDGLKCRCDSNSVLKSMDDVVSGDRVKVEKGPFAEFICQVDEIEDGHRVWVLINFLKQKTRARISRSDLSRIC